MCREKSSDQLIVTLHVYPIYLSLFEAQIVCNLKCASKRVRISWLWHCMADHAGGRRSMVNPGTKLWRPRFEVTQFWAPKEQFCRPFFVRPKKIILIKRRGIVWNKNCWKLFKVLFDFILMNLFWFGFFRGTHCTMWSGYNLSSQWSNSYLEGVYLHFHVLLLPWLCSVCLINRIMKTDKIDKLGYVISV